MWDVPEEVRRPQAKWPHVQNAKRPWWDQDCSGEDRTLFKMNTHISVCIAYISNLNYPPAQYNWGSARKRWKAWRLGRQEWGPVHAVQGFLQDSEENKFLLWNKLGLNFLVTGACIHFTGRYVPNALNVPGIFLYTWKIMVNGWFLGWKLEDLC